MDGWQVDGDGDEDGDDRAADEEEEEEEEEDGGREGCDAPNNLANRASL